MVGAVVPSSIRKLPIESDPEGNSVYRFVILLTKEQEFLNEVRKGGWNCKRFSYDYEKFQADQATRTQLESRMSYLTVSFSILL